jgi:hypothetical protein
MNNKTIAIRDAFCGMLLAILREASQARQSKQDLQHVPAR